MSLFTNKQFAVIAVAGVIGVYLIKKQAGRALDAVNPANSENVFHHGSRGIAEAIGGEGAFDTSADLFFGGLDLINPFAPQQRKVYAKKIYGIEAS